MTNEDDDVRDPIDARLDAELRAAFAPPPAAAFAEVARRARGPRLHRYLAPLLLAAAAVLVTLGVLLLARGSRAVGPEGHDGEQLGAMWAAAYRHAVAETGAPADTCCDPKLDFCACCAKQFDVRLSLGDGGKGLRLRGGYRGVPTGGCVAAVLDTPDGPVGVFAMPRDCDPGACLPEGLELQLVRREVGDLVLYAVAGKRQPSAQRELEQFVQLQ